MSCNDLIAPSRCLVHGRDVISRATPTASNPSLLASMLKMPNDRSLHLSDEFVISCGTVTVDVERRKVLAVCCRKTGEVLLPIGRKDVGESLEDAALRETSEETGYTARLLPLPICTLATTPTHASREPGAWSHVIEPVAVSQRITADQVLKIIFWFAAEGDSTQMQQADTQEVDEDFEALWLPDTAVADTLSFGDDARIASAVLDAIRTSISRDD